MKTLNVFLCLLLILMYTSCMNPAEKTEYPGKKAALSRINPEDFKTTINGKETALFSLENNKGIVLRLTNFGASMVQVIAPDSAGNYEDIILGYTDIEGYINDDMSLGCIVGRFANRIAHGKFSLNGKDYNLSINNGENSLHGGPGGIHSQVWDVKEKGSNSIYFGIVSPDMDEGYPGELTVGVRYTLTDNNEIIIDYEATTTDSTFINLTNHTYWNLNGEAETDILSHKLKVNADHITPVSPSLIPTGEYMNVESTPFDFREAVEIGKRIDDDHPQIIAGGGYDHNFVLDTVVRNEPVQAVLLVSEKSGRKLEVLTTEPGIQVYSGNFMDGTVTGKNGKIYEYRHGIALEAQHFPDSPNQPGFPSTLLLPGETYRQTTIFKLGLLEN